MSQRTVHYEPPTAIGPDTPYDEVWGASVVDESSEKLKAKRDYMKALNDNVSSSDWHVEAHGFIRGTAVMVLAPWNQVFEMAWSIFDATSCPFRMLLVKHESPRAAIQLSDIGEVDSDDIAKRMAALEQDIAANN